MPLWDLFFTSQPTAPPQLGAWYFLLPTSLVVVGLLSIRLASSKGYQNFWYWGQLIQLLIINSWYIAALWSLGPLGQLLDLSGPILPGGRKGCLENLSDDFWG